jgi:hypothetical protein
LVNFLMARKAEAFEIDLETGSTSGVRPIPAFRSRPRYSPLLLIIFSI